jgi:hypothetical protein
MSRDLGSAAFVHEDKDAVRESRGNNGTIVTHIDLTRGALKGR